MNFSLDSKCLFDIYKSLFDFNHDACYAIDVQGNFILFNAAAVALTGYSEEEALQMSFLPLIQEDLLPSTMGYFENVLKGKRESFITAITKKNGELADLSVTAVPIYRNNEIYGAVGMVRDITEKNTLELVLSGQNKVLDKIAKGCPFSDVLDSIIFFVQKVLKGGCCSILLVDQNRTNLVLGSAPSLPSDFLEHVDGISIGPLVGSCGAAAYHKRPVFVTDIGNDPRWANYKDLALKYGLRASWSSPVYDNQQNVLAVFAVYYDKPCTPNKADVDIIERATYLTSLAIQHYRAEDKINFMAFHDDLTGLPNRRLFDKQVNIAIRSASVARDQAFALMYLDLDRFKIINDSLGHNIGDSLLKDVSQRLTSCLRLKDTISRQGGDEFAILVTQVSNKEVTETAQTILDTLSKPFIVEGHEIFITPSIGICLYPLDGEHPEELLRKADVAMYHAKKEGKNNFQFYHSLLDKKTFERLELENELRKAMERKEFTLHYQPIINISLNEISGVEALIRWEHPKKGMISPAQFIPIAEETGMIVPIGEWVLRTACHQLQKWDRAGYAVPTMSVNISIRQFYQPNFLSFIAELLQEADISPNRLIIEITESMTMDVEMASNILNNLKSLGVRISIDDFGTGYSSLSYLKRFPLDFLKIDQSFIRGIGQRKENESIASTIILLAHNLGLRVIAEGVETEEQLEFLKKHHCNKAQGYYFSKPLAEHDLKLFIRK